MQILGHTIIIRNCADIELSDESIISINNAILEGCDGGAIVEHGTELDWEMQAELKILSEVTKKFFYSIINSGDKNQEVLKHNLYTDVVYFKYGVKLVCRFQNGYTNYYIQDIGA